jgi:6-phosphofructokinase
LDQNLPRGRSSPLDRRYWVPPPPTSQNPCFERLGGIAETVASQLQELIGQESRSIVLGHLLRGGSPTAIDRNLGVAFGAGAVQALAQGMNGVMVALQPPRLAFVPLQEAIAKLKLVLPDSEFVVTARALDISFGDRTGTA